MASTGELYPSAGATALESPWLDDDWVSPDAITAADSSYASVTSATFDTGDQTSVLKATGFGAALAADVTVNGIIVRVKGAHEQAGQAALGLVQLLDAGTKTGTNAASTEVALDTTPTEYTFGTSTDAWGLALTPTLVNDANFGVALGCWARGNNTDVALDSVSVEIFYTAPTGPDAVQLDSSVVDRWLSKRPGHPNWGANFTQAWEGKPSDLQVGDYLVGARARVTAINGSVVTLQRGVGPTFNVNWPSTAIMRYLR